MVSRGDQLGGRAGGDAGSECSPAVCSNVLTR